MTGSISGGETTEYSYDANSNLIQKGNVRYTYVQNDPVNFIDPSGEAWSSVWNGVKNAANSVVKI